jgi:urea transporter
MSATASCHFPFLNEWKQYCDKNNIFAFIDSVLSGYAQLAFNDNTFSGILMLIATWIGSPTLCINALWGTVIATAFAHIMHLSNGAIRAGIYGANAALSCLAVPVLLFSSQEISLLMLVVSSAIAIFTVLMVELLGKIFSRWNLPTLVIPYCIALSISLLILTLSGISTPNIASIETLLFTTNLSDWTTKELLLTFLNCASQILWLSKPVSGILYLIALLFASRLDTFNTMLAIVISMLISTLLGLPKEAVISGLYGYNAILLTQVMTRGFLRNKKSYTLTFCLSGLTVVMCCIYQLILPRLGIGSFLALPYLTLVFLAFANRKRLKGFTYVPAKYWGVPETIKKAAVHSII